MREIKFKDDYYLLIHNGEKTTTIRLNDKGLKAGDTARAIFLDFEGKRHREEYGYCTSQKLLIKRIAETQVKNLTEDDAKTEACKNLNELLNTLSDIYPDLKLNDKVYVFSFENLDQRKPII